VGAFHDLFHGLQTKVNQKEIDKPKSLYEVMNAIRFFQTRIKLKTAQTKLAKAGELYKDRENELLAEVKDVRDQLTAAKNTEIAMEAEYNKLLVRVEQVTDDYIHIKHEKNDLIQQGLGASSADPKDEIKMFPPLLKGPAPDCKHITLSYLYALLIIFFIKTFSYIYIY